MIHVYIVEPLILNRNIIIKDIKKIHYLKDVLRIEKKEALIIFDKDGQQYLCKIKNILPQEIILTIEKKITPKPILPRLTIAFGLIKKTAVMDDVINKLTQLGVYKIIPMITRRVVVKWDEAKIQKHTLRWQRIAMSACEQSHRAFIPIVEEVKGIQEIISKEEAELKLIFTLYKERYSLKSILTNKKGLGDILALIGPEGDFTPQELELAKAKGFIPVSLGDLVLRTETAIIAVASFIRLYAQD